MLFGTGLYIANNIPENAEGKIDVRWILFMREGTQERLFQVPVFGREHRIFLTRAPGRGPLYFCCDVLK